MNSGENIKNALQVIFKTYDNVQKLMEYCKTVASEKTNYLSVLSTNKFLRTKSDNYTEAWLISDFILLFQNKMSTDCKSGNGWRDDPIYVMEICLGEKEKDIYPLIHISKFEYDNISEWSEGFSPANHWAFYYPLRDNMNVKIIDGYTIRTLQNEKSSNLYTKYKKIVTKSIDLFEITADNVQEKIFGEFDRLSTIE